MITENDIITGSVPVREYYWCVKHAEACSIGCFSQIRGEDRNDSLSMDQLVGQVSTCFFSMWVGRTPEMGFRYYDMVRRRQNENPMKGDGGDDIPPFRVDVKGSMRRNLNLPLLKHRLPVRPAEFHDDWIYVLALTRPPKVHLIGWAYTSDLPSEVDKDGPFKGAYTLRGFQLRPLNDEFKEIVKARGNSDE